jgi:phosphocarrier protein HPr
MIEKRLEIINKLGLHARASAKLVQTAGKFESEVEISRDGRTVNGKSIMGVMMLAASQYTCIEVKVHGQDEQSALEAIEQLVSNKFGEEV